MSVTIDHETLETESLGLQTVGQVLSHVTRTNRLVVNLLIDGQRPDLDAMTQLRQSALLGKTLFIETADPRGMASQVLVEVGKQMDQADRLSADAVDFLRKDKAADAMQRLAGCFTIWQHAQESVMKTAQLLRIDLKRVKVGDSSLAELAVEFTSQLRLIKSALEDRDYATLCDVLTYEITSATQGWRNAILAMRGAIAN